ncbi:MAG: type II toxin-antitoxin system RelE/ParE family toxin [Lachnospiraceae bacterium]|nr:type II toxin-antitoxin system RelE/ParE family toxin [Lachnospiraceae bacterium]
MTRTFIQTKEFSKNWDGLGYDDEDLRKLELELLKNSSAYPVIRGTGGLRKMRFALDNEGKSGGVRICYVDFVVAETIYLITVYPKSEKDNLSQAERNEIKKLIKRLEDSL